MELVRSQNANAISEFYPHEFFHEDAIFQIFLKNLKKFKFFKRKVRGQAPALPVLAREPGWRFTARCHTKTVAKRKRSGGCTQILLTMEITFLNVNAAQSMLGSLGWSLSYVWRLRMEIVISQNTRAISEFYPHEIFLEGAIFESFLEKSQNFRIFEKKNKGPGSCSTSSRAGTRLTVHRALPYQNSR